MHQDVQLPLSSNSVDVIKEQGGKVTGVMGRLYSSDVDKDRLEVIPISPPAEESSVV